MSRPKKVRKPKPVGNKTEARKKVNKKAKRAAEDLDDAVQRERDRRDYWEQDA